MNWTVQLSRSVEPRGRSDVSQCVYRYDIDFKSNHLINTTNIALLSLPFPCYSDLKSRFCLANAVLPCRPAMLSRHAQVFKVDVSYSN